jgi:hypothetical protein
MPAVGVQERREEDGLVDESDLLDCSPNSTAVVCMDRRDLQALLSLGVGRPRIDRMLDDRAERCA